MKKQIEILLVLCLISSALLQNTSRAVYPQIQEMAREMVTTQDVIKKHLTAVYVARLMEFDSRQNGLKSQFKMNNLQKKHANACLQGRSASSMTEIEYLKLFAEGECSPVVILPGIAASKLVVSIDCPVVKEKYPSIFAVCGWQYCDGGPHSPDPEYTMWLPDVFSPMSLVKPTDKTRACFTGLVGLEIEEKEPHQARIKEKDGIKVTAIGDSEMTKGMKKSQCGFKAIEDMLPLPYIPAGYHYFKYMKELYIAAGYKVGINLQALPYDFRKKSVDNKLNDKFEKIINKMNKITGKKVVIVAHSYGNYQVLNNLWNMDQEVKDAKIARYLALAPPFMGAPKTTYSGLGMDTSYHFDLKFVDIGLTPKMYKATVGTFEANFDLLVKGVYEYHKDTDWMKDVMSRIEAEKTGKDTKINGESVMNIFPSAGDDCFKGFKYRTNKCKTGLFRLYKVGQVKDDEINPSTYREIFDEYSYNPVHGDIYEDTYDHRFTEMENPGVQVNVLYSSVVPTVSEFTYKNDPKTKTMKNQFYEPEVEKTEMGDGSVLVTSAITPAIKWAHEFMTKELESAKPVSFMEMCSSYQPRTSVFAEGKTQVEDNEYFGVDCNCRAGWISDSDGDACNHQKLVEDPAVTEFVLLSSMKAERGETDPDFKELGETKIKSFQQNCDLFHLNF